jgi:hypothetical protein
MKSVLRLHYILLLAMCPFLGLAQNLVPNPSFETYTGCPAGNSAISNGFVPNWNRPPGSIITPDLFTPCTSSGLACTNFNTANNCVGSSTAFHGTSYAGFLWYYTGAPNLKEYIVAQLTSTCVAGTVYRACYRAKLGNLCRYGTNRLALYISAAAPSQPGGNQPILITPTIERAGQVLDKVNWTSISGTFIANGTENYITIGNFYNDGSTSIFNFGASAGTCAFATGGAYYMIDSVIVQPSAPLPITVHAFAGKAQANGDVLSWNIAPATQMGELWLDHSTDGMNFSTIAQWMNPTEADLTRHYLNENPTEGMNYYRLGMADQNGEFMVSEVVALRRGPMESLRLNLQPNPAGDQAWLSFALPADAEGFAVFVRAMNGAEVWSAEVSSTLSVAEVVLPTAGLEAGVYAVEVRCAGLRGVKRLVVVH